MSAAEVKKAVAARAIASGSTKAAAAREAGVDPAQITRWTKQPAFQEMVRIAAEPVDDAPDPQQQATTGLRDLVPQALRVLEDALAGADISPQQQTVALNVIKAAKQLEPVGQAEAGPSTLQAAIEAIERERPSSTA